MRNEKQRDYFPEGFDDCACTEIFKEKLGKRKKLGFVQEQLRKVNRASDINIDKALKRNPQ